MAEEKKETEPAEKKAKCTLFTDVNGCVSMRRFFKLFVLHCRNCYSSA